MNFINDIKLYFLLRELRKEGARKMLQGYRTYLTLIVLILHQVLKVTGYDIGQEALSTAADTILGIAAFYFRSKASNK